MNMLNEENLVKAMAMVIDGRACVKLTKHEIKGSYSYTPKDERLPKYCKGSYISNVISTTYIDLGYHDIVRHAKGIVLETPTLGPGDYAGSIEVNDCESDYRLPKKKHRDGSTFLQAYRDWRREIGDDLADDFEDKARKALAAYRENEGEEGLWTPLEDTPEGLLIGNMSGTCYN